MSATAFLISDGDGCAWRNNHLFSEYRCEGINLGASGVILGLAARNSCVATNSPATGRRARWWDKQIGYQDTSTNDITGSRV